MSSVFHQDERAQRIRPEIKKLPQFRNKLFDELQ